MGAWRPGEVAAPLQSVLRVGRRIGAVLLRALPMLFSPRLTFASLPTLRQTWGTSVCTQPLRHKGNYKDYLPGVSCRQGGQGTVSEPIALVQELPRCHRPTHARSDAFAPRKGLPLHEEHVQSDH